MTNASFPRAARLTERSQFLSAQANGKRYSGRFVVIYVDFTNQSGRGRIGLTVSKKVSHRAVNRNLIRRRLRHIGRVYQTLISKPADIVLIAKPQAINAEFSALVEDVTKLYKKAGLLSADCQSGL